MKTSVVLFSPLQRLLRTSHHLDIDLRVMRDDLFPDDWVGKGYEKAGSAVLSAIRTAAEMEGLVLEHTYTGKAFAALLDLVRAGEVKEKSRVLFWHTGGLMNLMTSGYFAGDILGT